MTICCHYRHQCSNALMKLVHSSKIFKSLIKSTINLVERLSPAIWYHNVTIDRNNLVAELNESTKTERQSNLNGKVTNISGQAATQKLQMP